MSEHCRLYFGALQKAIGGFVGSLQDGQPPEKFISQSKLVIMVGQRLVDTLYREAHRKGSNQSLLCKSNHLCALLKQLAVATKKAALHFPDKQALREAQEFATQLAQRAQHFRLSLELWGWAHSIKRTDLCEEEGFIHQSCSYFFFNHVYSVQLLSLTMLLLLLMNAGCCLNINNCRKKPPAQVISKRYCICTKRQYQYKLHIRDAVIKPMLKCILSTEYKVFFSRLMGNVYSLSFVGYLCFSSLFFYYIVYGTYSSE